MKKWLKNLLKAVVNTPKVDERLLTNYVKYKALINEGYKY
jgi:hypothetical protein